MASKILKMNPEDMEQDRELILRRLRQVISEGQGIAAVQASKLLWEMMGKPTRKPAQQGDEEAITFLIAGPLNDDEIPGNQASA